MLSDVIKPVRCNRFWIGPSAVQLHLNASTIPHFCSLCLFTFYFILVFLFFSAIHSLFRLIDFYRLQLLLLLLIFSPVSLLCSNSCADEWTNISFERIWLFCSLSFWFFCMFFYPHLLKSLHLDRTLSHLWCFLTDCAGLLSTSLLSTIEWVSNF